VTARLAACKPGSFQFDSPVSPVERYRSLGLFESAPFVYTIFLSIRAGSQNGELASNGVELYIKRIDSRVEESCNGKVQNVPINIVTISELARLVYDRILTKGSSEGNMSNFLESIWLVRNPSASPDHNQGEL